MYLRVLHIPEKGSAYKQILLNYLDIWIIHMFDLIWPKNIKFLWGGGAGVNFLKFHCSSWK